MNFWLMKSEPDVYGIDDLKKAQVDHWDGIRNYQARNFMRDDIKKGDLAFFYHSNCSEPGIVGIMSIEREGYPDHTALDPQEKYYDPKSTADDPRWFMVDVKYVRKLDQAISLKDLKEHKPLADLQLLRRGNRLSIIPVSKKQWDYIINLEK